MAYKDITPPAGGKITTAAGKLNVPENPVIPFIRGDGTGPDIWAASVRVFDAAVQKASGGKRKVSWFEVFAGEYESTVTMLHEGLTPELECFEACEQGWNQYIGQSLKQYVTVGAGMPN